MAPKKKGTKMDLGSFLETSGGGSWADEMDAMPSAPGEFEDLVPSYKRGPGGDRGDSSRFGGPEREARPPRPDVPFPDAPPYTAFVGNMSFETGEDEIKDMFVAEGLTVTSVRVVKDHAGKLKGFCYVEFPEADMLRHALTLSNTPLGGRNIRVSVAEPPRAGEQGRSAGDWTRSGPLPDLPGRGGNRPTFGDRQPPAMDSGRDWGDARGSKFAPSAPSSPSMGSRPGFGDRREPPSARGGFRERDASAGSVGDADRDWSAMRGGKFVPAPEPVGRGPPERRPSGFADRKQSEDTRDWRARTAPVSPPAGAESSAPPQRRKLELSARTVSSSSPAEVTSPSSSKASPFGAATPVNTAEREKEINARLEKEKTEAAEKRAAAAAEAAEQKKASNPFGQAKPVDNSAREKEVDEKLIKEREELANRLKDANITASDEKGTKEDSRAGKPWRNNTPANTSSQANNFANSQDKVKAISSDSSKQQQEKAPAAAAKTFQKNQGLRKEGFSFANVAGVKSPSSEEPPKEA